MTGQVVTRPALRWFGGKWRLAPWILSHLPPHAAYCEPYGGAASVLLRKPPAKLETWNDLHGRLVNYFRVLREQPADLCRAILLTPYAREEYDAARALADDPLEDARRFAVLAGQGRVGAAGGGYAHGWRYIRDVLGRNGGTPADEFSSVEHLYAIAARFKHVQIEHDQALAVLERYDHPTTLHYVDPPYVTSTRCRDHTRYEHELTDDGHRALAEALHRARGMVVLSGYLSPLYEDLYGEWERIDRENHTDNGFRVECLWLNPAAARARGRQLTFGA